MQATLPSPHTTEQPPSTASQTKVNNEESATASANNDKKSNQSFVPTTATDKTIQQLMDIADTALGMTHKNVKNRFAFREQLERYAKSAGRADSGSDLSPETYSQLNTFTKRLNDQLRSSPIIDANAFIQESKGHQLVLTDARDLYIALAIGYTLSGNDKQATKCLKNGVYRLTDHHSPDINIETLARTMRWLGLES